MSKAPNTFAAALLTIFAASACGPLDGSGAPGHACAAIAEPEGKSMARGALWVFIRKWQADKITGNFRNGDREISASRILAIQPGQLHYTGILDGDVEDGKIFLFRVAKVDELEFNVWVFNNCNTKVSWLVQN